MRVLSQVWQQASTATVILPRAQIRLCTTANAQPLPRRLRRLVAVLHAAKDARNRSLRLVRLGEALPHASITELGPRTRVPGCVSVVHIHAHATADGLLKLAGAADSRLARGLVMLLVSGLRGEPARVARTLVVREVAEAAGLSELLTPGRLNGMEAMLRVLITQLDEEQAIAARSTEQQTSSAPQHQPSCAQTPRDAAPVAHPRLLWAAAPEEVALLLSGGVDSSVALHELLAAGHRVRAFYLRIWLEEENAHAARGLCPWEEDWAYCDAACRQAGVPLESVSLQDEYQRHVVGYLVAEAAAGRTPNPDVMCNSRIKFGVFHERIGRHFSHVASGHYARVAPSRGGDGASSARVLGGGVGCGGVSGEGSESRVQLLRSADAHKDQTYFLSQLTQSQLSTALFPIGAMDKPEVRAVAHRLHLPTRHRRDSQGICFLGQLKYDDFLHDHLGESHGPYGQIRHEPLAYA